MKFKDFSYKRPDMESFKIEFENLLKDFENAKDFTTQDEFMSKINDLRNEFESNNVIASIKYSLDSQNKKNEDEQDFFDNNQPIYESLISKYYKSLVKSKFKDQLEKKWGKQLFNIAELSIKTFSDEIIDDLKEENKLTSEYDKLAASAKIKFDGKELTLPQLRPYQQSLDRDVRKAANEAKYSFLTQNEEKLDTIYDKLVKCRNKIAKKLGYENFIKLGYNRMLRSDYDADMVKVFRKEIENQIVPLVSELKAKQSKRLDIKPLKYYDEAIQFKDGNPDPIGTPDEIINNAKTMYKELSDETNEFFNYMMDSELMDLLSKKGKTPGGYCDYIAKYKSPFIFANFNGTSGDVDVLTHEAGHAFQVYSSREYKVPEYIFPTYEACEIHSMSMEFLTWPWMNLFYGDKSEKSKYIHLIQSVTFLTYGVTVDEYQHFVYENPDASILERKQAWRKIEKKYLPERDYEDNEYLEKGCFWHQQGHIFSTPFYYIDYVLAQTCAFQFWTKSLSDKEKTWEEYVNLCKAGGSKSFLELVKLAKLKSPFEEGSLKSVVETIKDWLGKIDDSKF